MKKRRLILPIFLLVWVLICGVAFGFMVTRTTQKDNLFIPAKVMCDVETAMNAEKTKITSAKVQNTGNVDAYIRVRVVSYWVQKDGLKDQIVSKKSKMPTINWAPGWKQNSAKDTYYYIAPIVPGETVTFFSQEIELETETAENPSDPPYRQVVEFFAEAIQSNPEKASKESWGITIAGNGNIMTVP